MAGTRTRATRQDEGTKQRGLTDQHTPFVGLFLAPFAVLLVSWVLHYAITGMNWGPIKFGGSQAALGVAIILVTLGAVGLSVQAWSLAHDRYPPLRRALTGTTFVVVQWTAILIWVGPHRWWDLFFVLIAWICVGLWVLPRLHVLRRDPREKDNDGEDGLMKELHLEGFKFGKPVIQHDPVTGEPTRADYDVKHRLGATRKTLADALPNLESAVGAPEHLSRAVKPVDGKSNHTTLTLILKDPLVGRVPYDGPSHPGGSITDPAHIGRYDDGDPVHVWIAGGFTPDLDAKGRPVIGPDGKPQGIKFPPTGYAFMGMTRAGKTVGENRLLLESAITRTDAVILYCNKSKGDQDVGPIIDGVEVAILTDDKRSYTEAMRQAREIITYRQRELAKHSIQAWSAEKCFHNPPPGMEPMPALICHFGEADAILESSGEEAVYLASKGLSTGVICGWSLQRWAATSMPTDLRFNIGARFCYGVGDDYSAGFALSEPTIAAGAHPENWRNTKPGRFFVEAAGIDDTRWPVSAKTIGDTDDDALYGNMRRDAAEYAPNMARLDKGSATATRGWWDKHVRNTDKIRDRILGRGEFAPAAATPPAAPTPAPYAPPTNQETTVPPWATDTDTAGFDPQPPTDDQDADRMSDLDETEEEIRDIHDVDGDRILGDLVEPDEDDPEFADLRSINPSTILPTPPADDVDLTENRSEAPSPEAAQDALDEALRKISRNPKFADPADTSGRTVVFRTGQLREAYPFRTRQWYSPMLIDLAEGRREVPPGLALTRAADRKGEGWYRLTRTDEGSDGA